MSKVGHMNRARNTRKILSGFPITEPFTTQEAVKDYLNGEKIVCLLCGKSYKALGIHIKVHGWDEEQYREYYGLPWGTGLTCSGTKKLQRENTLRRIAEGEFFRNYEPGAFQHLTTKAPHRKRAPYHNVMTTKNMHKNRPSEELDKITIDDLRIWKDGDFWPILSKMREQDQTLREVCLENGSPDLSVVYKFIHKNKDFATALEAVWENLSFPAQARAERLGKRFLKKAAALRLGGKSAHEIGRILGVSRITVARHTVGLPKGGHQGGMTRRGMQSDA